MFLAQISRISLLCLAVCSCLIASGCGGAAKKIAIDELIRVGTEMKPKVVQDSKGMLSDFKVYRDGTEDGVVFEHVLVKDAKYDPKSLEEANVKSVMLGVIRSDPSFKLVFEQGVYVKVLYSDAAGEPVVSSMITKADL